MRHYHLNKRRAFDLIATELDAGRQVTDQQLMDVCGLWQSDQIKSLLADLAEEGAISISWDGPRRTIVLGPKERARPAPVVPPLSKPDYPMPPEPVSAAQADSPAAGNKGRQINIRLPADVYAALIDRSDRTGRAVGAIARDVFLEAFDAAACDTKRRHKLSAALVRAAREDGFELASFVTDMIALGLESYRRERGREAAE